MALVVLPKQLMVDGSGNPRSGAKAYFYQSGTTTPITVYTTSAYSVAHSNPVIANASGLFPAVYINPTVNPTYKLVVKDSSDVEIYSEDNIPALGFTQADVGATLYPRTAAEIAAGVTPTNYAYPPGDLRRYGAVAGEDATTALQRACDACPVGGTVIVAEAYYSGEVKLKNWTGRAIVGPGSLTMINGAANDGAILRFEGTCSNVIIRRLTFRGRNNAGLFEQAIAAGTSASVANVLVEGCTFLDINVGIYVNGSAGGGLHGGWRIVNNYFDNILGTDPQQGLAVLLEHALACVVHANIFRRTHRHAVYVSQGADTNHVISNNIFELHRDGVAAVTSRPAVTVGRCRNVLIEGNTFRECSDGGVEVFCDTLNGLDGEKVLITGNRFLNRKNNVPDVIIGESEVPVANRVYDVTVQGNQFTLDQATGGTNPPVYITNGQRLEVINNSFRVFNAATPQYLIRLGDDNFIADTADCTETIIEGNNAWVSGAAATSCRMVVVAAKICANASAHKILNNRRFGPLYIDFLDTVSNTNIDTDYSWTKTWNPGTIAAGGQVSTTITVPGAVLGDYAIASLNSTVGEMILSAKVTATNTVTVTLANNTASDFTVGEGTLRVRRIFRE